MRMGENGGIGWRIKNVGLKSGGGGGVAEWSNAPHLKCGVPQGTVSSNLTPSALLIKLTISYVQKNI